MAASSRSALGVALAKATPGSTRQRSQALQSTLLRTMPISSRRCSA